MRWLERFRCDRAGSRLTLGDRYDMARAAVRWTRISLALASQEKIIGFSSSICARAIDRDPLEGCLLAHVDGSGPWSEDLLSSFVRRTRHIGPGGLPGDLYRPDSRAFRRTERGAAEAWSLTSITAPLRRFPTAHFGTWYASRRVHTLCIPPARRQHIALAQPCASYVDSALTSHFSTRRAKTLSQNSNGVVWLVLRALPVKTTRWSRRLSSPRVSGTIKPGSGYAQKTE